MAVLLTRCLDDVDDEVRDRAALNLRLMNEPDELANRFVKNGEINVKHKLIMLTNHRGHVLSDFF